MKQKVPNTCARAEAAELIDRPDDMARDELERSLSDLELANRWLGGRSAVLPYVLPLVGECSSFLEVGCGGADLLRAISDEGRRRERSLHLVGLDISPAVLWYARSRCRSHPRIELLLGDATELPFSDGAFDVVFSSTFVHHLEPAEAVQAIREAARVARRRVVAADLVRSTAGWIGALAVGRLLFGRLSRYDGPVSFRRAYTPDELLALARKAGLTNCQMRRHSLCRMSLICDKGVGDLCA